MHFSLPSNLQQEVIKYDKTLKSLTRSEKPKSRTVKYPKGNVISLGLIPENVVKLSDQQEAIDHINRAAASNAFHLFIKPVLGGDPKPLAVIYYLKQYWIACWMPRDKDADYIYGITVAFRNNATALKQFNNRLFPHVSYDKPAIVENIDQMERTKIGRTEWLHRTLIVNKEMLNKGYKKHYWREVDGNHVLKSYGHQMQNIFRAVNQWYNQLFDDIPTWTGRYAHPNFDRLTNEGGSLYYCMKEECYWMKPHVFSGNKHSFDSYEHTVDYHLKKIKSMIKTAAFDSTLDRPWFRKYLAAALTETQQRYDKAGHKACVETICQPVNCIAQYLDSLSYIYYIYPDANPDVLQNHHEMFEQLDIIGRYKNAREWIHANVPFDSFINMLKRYFDKRLEEHKSAPHHRRINMTGKYRIFTRDLSDTMAMIDQCIEGCVTDNLKPRRWRLNEWHDHVMKEAWKVKNPNVDLPQKLFPEPIKISYNNTTNYTLLQPRDTHQLSHWGTAVRNCVGTHGYFKGIQQFKHIIVLCMIDKEPRYTIQLTVDNGVMHVSQIADVCNKRLTDQQRYEIETVFKTALKLRDQQLEPV